MLKSHILLLFLVLFLSVSSFAEEVPQSVHKLAPELMKWGKNEMLVDAVAQQNSKGMSLDKIKSLDKKWMETVGVDDFIRSLMENKAAKELLRLENSKPYFIELFLMDNQGANVALTNKTSDYWQGDEAKFKKSFNSGKGALHIGKVKFDKSSQAYLVQISVPVIKEGEAIGALTIGVNLDELEK